MSKNTLFKDVTKTYIPGDPGIPADPGRPYIPPRIRQVTETMCSYGPDYAALAALGIVRTQVIDRQTGQLVWMWQAPPGVSGSLIPYTYSCETVTYSVAVPEQSYVPPTPGVPATAAKVIQDFRLGWNARARSIRAYPGAVLAEFKVPRTATGMVVGLNTAYSPSGYADIRFAFYIGHGLARVMEGGVQKASLGAYADEAVFKLRRLRGKVTYYINDVQVWESDNSAEPFFLDAAIYVGGDTVYDPAITGLSVGDGELRPLAGAGGVASSFSAGAIGPLTSVGGVFYRSDTTLLPLTGLGGDYPYAASFGELPPLSGEGSGADLLPGYAISDGVLVPISSVSSGLTGQIGGGATQVAALTGLASEGVYGDSRAQLHPITGFGRALSEEERRTLVMYSRSGAGGPLRAIGGLVLVLNSSATAVSVLAVTREAFLSLVSEAAALTSLGAAGRFSLELFSALRSRSSQGEAAEAGAVWVVNAETGATTRYENFDFNSYAKIGDTYFGCKADGVYRLDGDTDAGDLIQAMVSFGKQNFGTSALKRITNAYVGVSGQGRMFLKVMAEGQEYTYAARSYDEHLQVQRIDTGKGLRVNWLEFELYNADGEDFELASVEFAAVPLSRRI